MKTRSRETSARPWVECTAEASPAWVQAERATGTTVLARFLRCGTGRGDIAGAAAVPNMDKNFERGEAASHGADAPHQKWHALHSPPSRPPSHLQRYDHSLGGAACPTPLGFAPAVKCSARAARGRKSGRGLGHGALPQQNPPARLAKRRATLTSKDALTLPSPGCRGNPVGSSRGKFGWTAARWLRGVPKGAPEKAPGTSARTEKK